MMGLWSWSDRVTTYVEFSADLESDTLGKRQSIVDVQHLVQFLQTFSGAINKYAHL
jgi:hypothetical protein